MINVKELVDYCDNLYKNSETQCRCKDCKNDCQGSCEKCLDKIHFGDTRRYNCFNITNYYLCKYIYKYSSEIEHLLVKDGFLEKLPMINALSIGCGPCTDLVGIVNSVDYLDIKTKVNYTGVDMNNIWKHIHEYIKSYNDDNFEATFLYSDIFDALDSQEGISYNIIVLQYVLSDMNKYDTDGVNTREFIDRIVDKIIRYMKSGSIIIINDINYKSARQYYEYLLNKLKSLVNDGMKFRYACRHFNNNVRQSHYDYGYEYQSNRVTTVIPRGIAEDYNSWDFCSSAQLIVVKDE
ncbi:methyltransferase domain-containing protein [Clostridium butyricum]|uniref:methyltransferase domain-containing protein n=1 Tax=Clostridium butyricum TaxID=1492 RepID=UPI002ABE4F68|nr:methyltransferase domain-containing protein [Clostridium butyricum]